MRNTIVSLCALLTSFAVAKRGGEAEQKLFFRGQEFPEASFATKHRDVVLECEVGGSPSPTIHWLKDGERIQQVIYLLFYLFIYSFILLFISIYLLR